MEKTLRICSHGHKYYKSSDCPTCPACEKSPAVTADLFKNLASPARRALINNKIDSLEVLSGYTEKQLLSMHGIGPSSIPKLKAALDVAGLTFKRINNGEE